MNNYDLNDRMTKVSEHSSLIYLDYNASTPIDPEVVEAMMPYITTHFGNPSSNHELGNIERKAIQSARHSLAEAFQARDGQVVFTNGGSEANNLAIKGIAYTLREKGNHIIISSIEHPAVSAVVKFLGKNGYKVTVIPVDKSGLVNPQTVEKAIQPNTVLISIMLANNEVGTVQPISEISEVAHSKGVLVHTDAAQAVGKISVKMDALGVDLMSIAGHKFYAPKGVGALIFRNGLKPEPLIHGAGHENGFRAGTENTPYLVALGKAAELAVQRLPSYQERVTILRDKLHQLILSGFPDAVLNGHPEKRLPNTLNLSFPGVDAAQLMNAIQNRIACSTGSACHSGTAEPSQMLMNMGLSSDMAKSSLRLSLGLYTSMQEIEEAGKYILSKLHELVKAKTQKSILAN